MLPQLITSLQLNKMVIEFIFWVFFACVLPGYCLLSFLHDKSQTRSSIEDFCLALAYGIVFLTFVSVVLSFFHLYNLTLVILIISTFIVFTIIRNRVNPLTWVSRDLFDKKNIPFYLVVILFIVVSYINFFNRPINFYPTDQYSWISSAKYLLYGQLGILHRSIAGIQYPHFFSAFLSMFFLFTGIDIQYAIFFKFFTLFFVFCTLLGSYIFTARIVGDKIIASIAPIILFSGYWTNYYFFATMVVPQNIGFFLFFMLVLSFFHRDFKSKNNMGFLFLMIGLYFMYSPALFLLICAMAMTFFFIVSKELYNLWGIADKSSIRDILTERISRATSGDVIVFCFMLPFLTYGLIALSKYILILTGILEITGIQPYYAQTPSSFVQHTRYFGHTIWYLSLIGISYLYGFRRRSDNKSLVLFVFSYFIFIYSITLFPHQWYLAVGMGIQPFRYLNYLTIALPVLISCFTLVIYNLYQTRSTASRATVRNFSMKVLVLLSISLIVSSSMVLMMNTSRRSVEDMVIESNPNLDTYLNISYWLLENSSDSSVYYLFVKDANFQVYTLGILSPRTVYTHFSPSESGILQYKNRKIDKFEVHDSYFSDEVNFTGFIQTGKSQIESYVIVDSSSYPILNNMLNTSNSSNFIVSRGNITAYSID